MAAPTASTLSERVQGYIGQKLLPTIVDGVFSGNILLYRLLMGNAKPWTGGPQIVGSVIVSKSNQGGSFQGADLFETAVEDTTIRLAFDPKAVYQPVTILGTEKSITGMSDERKMVLVTNKMAEAKMNMADKLGVMIYGDGTGNGSADFLGLGAIIDDGTVATTYGGQTRASYETALDANLIASVGTLTLDHMATQVDEASGTGGTQTTPTLIVTTKAIYSLYESLLTPTVRNQFDSFGPMRVFAKGPAQRVTEFGGNQGFNALAFRGIPIVADEMVPSGRMYFINEHFLTFYYITDPDLESVPQSSQVEGSVYDNAPKLSPIQWRGFMQIPNQYGMTGQLIIQGNLVSFAPRRHAISTGITSA